MINSINKGFTLLEILLVITLISILFGIVVFRLSPNNILSEIQDNQRESDALTIYQALEQYALKNNVYPEAIKNMPNNSSAHICKTTATTCDLTKINLSSILVPTYFTKIPEYSKDANNSGFYVVKDSNGKIGIGGVKQVDNTTFVKGLESQSFTTNPTEVILYPLSIKCNDSNISGLLAWGVSTAGATITIPYDNGNGQSYSQQTISSTGITGLTATLNAGNFSNGSGNLTFNITGTPSGIGVVNFNSNINGNNCYFSANAIVPPIVTNNLVLHLDAGNTISYPGTGTTWNDLSENNLYAELVNNPVYNSSNSPFFQFNGSNFARIPNSTILDTQTPTVEVWIKTNIISQFGFWFEKGNLNTQYSLFQQNNFIYWRQKFTNGSLLSLLAQTSNFMNTSSWYQVVATFTSGNRRLYINGNLVNSDKITGTIETNNGGVSIGAYGGYSPNKGYYYNGNIANIKVYNRNLSDLEIQQNFNALRGRFGL